MHPKTWLLRAAVSAMLVSSALAACTDDGVAGATRDGGATTTPTGTTTGTTTAPTSTRPAPVDAGVDARRSGCVDRPDRPQGRGDRLPCELIPPGLTL